MAESARQAEEQRTRLAGVVAELERLRPAIEQGAPWPMAERFGHEPEASWGPPEVLAHVAEMMSFWLGETGRILEAGADEPVPFGRVATDDVRIGIIGRDRSLPPAVLFDAIDAARGRWDRQLARLTDADAARRGVHPTAGEFPVGPLVDRFVINHIEEHVRQLETVLGSGGQQPT